MSRHQPECDCNARPGTRHTDGCSALTPPPAPPTREEAKFNEAWRKADPGEFGARDN